MRWQYNHGAPPLFFAVIIAIALIGALWRRRRQQGAVSLMLMVAGAGVWALGEAMETGCLDMATKLWWARFRYIGIVTVPTAWLVFALQFSRLRRWVAPYTLLALSALPAVNLAMVWTDPMASPHLA